MLVNDATRHATVVVPTYNEIDNIQRLVPALLALACEGWSIGVCVVDDDSPDGTGRWVAALAAREPRVAVVRRVGVRGLGTAYIAGMRAALAAGSDAVLTMDADFSHHPRYVPDLLAGLAEADLVIGSRYVPGGAVLYPLHRRLLSRTANAVANRVLGLAARDATAGFRAYRQEVLASVPLESIFSNGYSFLLEMLFLVQARGWRVAETPITFADREHGTSKISSREIGRALYTCARLGVRRVSGGRRRAAVGSAETVVG